MADVRTNPGSVIVFSTKSDDYRALVSGPNGKHRITSGSAVDVRTPGHYTVLVIDRQLRRVKARIEGNPPTSPQDYSEEGDEMVAISIEVRP
jgi:hypothetical protein